MKQFSLTKTSYTVVFSSHIETKVTREGKNRSCDARHSWGSVGVCSLRLLLQGPRRIVAEMLLHVEINLATNLEGGRGYSHLYETLPTKYLQHRNTNKKLHVSASNQHTELLVQCNISVKRVQ